MIGAIAGDVIGSVHEKAPAEPKASPWSCLARGSPTTWCSRSPSPARFAEELSTPHPFGAGDAGTQSRATAAGFANGSLMTTQHRTAATATAPRCGWHRWIGHSMISTHWFVMRCEAPKRRTTIPRGSKVPRPLPHLPGDGAGGRRGLPAFDRLRGRRSQRRLFRRRCRHQRRHRRSDRGGVPRRRARTARPEHG